MKKRAPATKRTANPLEPRISVLLIEGHRLRRIDVGEISVGLVGHKAMGLASLPTQWTKPFFVVSGEQHPSQAVLAEALESTGIPNASRLIVRSSGLSETIAARGSLQSIECSAGNLALEIARLMPLANETPKVSNPAVVHWVVQELIDVAAKGHLSNERRIAEAKRDWLVETEATPPYPNQLSRIPLRSWRDKRAPLEKKLSCLHRESISAHLSTVARWTYERLIRVHYEWVWDGTALYLVQADPCDEVLGGVTPKTLVQSPSKLQLVVPQLAVFRSATEQDFKLYRKLANAQIYSELGYKIPPFYVLDNQAELRELIENGRCSEALKSDLRQLTSRPLVIRTDGQSIPTGLREMLPRSDELRTVEAAERWLVQNFRAKVTRTIDGSESALANSSLCLIAHHFIAATAAAWCQALPNERRVRIEALWGIPEGLYWYAYDVFDVDTQSTKAITTQECPQGITFREKCRYKEHFIAPDADGAWVVHRTSELADWKRSITKAEWIEEIAWTSRCIATKEQKPVVVMWLIDTVAAASEHRVLPWYHQEWKFEGMPHKAAPRKKLSASSEAVISTLYEWQALKDSLAEGKLVARIRVEPRDPQLVRDQGFVKSLAEVAREKKIVVELSGGILSHAYYMLSSAGCEVECIDLDDFALDDEEFEFNKLVRDGIPAAISSRGERVASLKLEREALTASLRRKLVEEAFEVLDAPTNQQITEELADLREVALGLMVELGISEADVESARRHKLKKRGGFRNGTMLTRTAVMSSFAGNTSYNEIFDTDISQLVANTLFKEIELPSSIPEGIHVDQRLDAVGNPERQFTISLPVHASGFTPPRVAFSLADQKGVAHEMALEVGLEREGGEMRIRMRLSNTPEQLQLNLDLPEI